jgi:hypothetical protein
MLYSDETTSLWIEGIQGYPHGKHVKSYHGMPSHIFIILMAKIEAQTHMIFVDAVHDALEPKERCLLFLRPIVVLHQLERTLPSKANVAKIVAELRNQIVKIIEEGVVGWCHD